MPAGTGLALTVLRVARGAPAPSDTALHAAIERDRARLRVEAGTAARELRVAGPYHITVDGQELDEYVVWEV